MAMKKSIMDELNKGLEICLRSKEAERAHRAFKRQLTEWDLAMPQVTPLILDFGLGDFKNIGLIEYWIANEVDAGYCGKYLFVFDGQTCPRHKHKEKMETFFIVKGYIMMTYGNDTFRISPGDVLQVDKWKYHSFTGKGPALLLEISMPCIIDDNYFEDTRIPIGGNYKGETQS